MTNDLIVEFADLVHGIASDLQASSSEEKK